MPNYPYTFQLPPLNVQDIPNDGVAGEFLGINGSGVLDWLTAGGGGTGDMLKADNLSGLASYPTARTNLGLGTGDSPTFANLTLTSPSLVSSAPVTISQTWNNAAVVFTGLRFNAAGTSGTNSAAGSVLFDLQVGGATKVSVNKDGAIGGYAYNGLNASGGGTMQVASGNATFGYHMARDYCVTWGGAATLNGSIEVSLCRDGAANTLALRNGANGQTFSVYGTYPGAAWERFTITAPTSGNVLLGTYTGTGGIARGLEFQTDGVTRMTLSASSHIIQFNSSCELLTASGTGTKFDFSFNGLQYSNISGLGVSWANNANASTSKHVGLFAYSTELGVVQVNDSTKDTFRDLRVRSVIQQPPATITPASNGDLVVEATSNTTLTFKLKGTDGTVRSGTITLSV